MEVANESLFFNEEFYALIVTRKDYKVQIKLLLINVLSAVIALIIILCIKLCNIETYKILKRAK